MNIHKKVLALLLSLTLVLSPMAVAGVSAADAGDASAVEKAQTDLEELIGTASPYKETDYLGGDWAIFAPAFKEAKENEKSNDLGVLTKMMSTLRDAIAPLKSEKSDIETLQSDITAADQFKNSQNDYTPDTWQIFDQMYKAAQEMFKGIQDNISSVKGTDADIKKAATNLENAHLVKKDSTVEVKEIKMLKTAEVIVNKTITLSTSVQPSNAAVKTLTWKSSDNSIATVDSKGKITGKTAGTATITATANNGVFADCTVTVIAEATADQKATEAMSKLQNIDASDKAKVASHLDDIKAAVSAVTALSDPVSAVGKDSIDKLEALLETLTSAPTYGQLTSSVVKDSSISDVKVSGLLLAAGFTGDETDTTVALQPTQIEPAKTGDILTFSLKLTETSAGEPTDISDELEIPVTVTFKLPSSFHYSSNYTYSIRHDIEGGDPVSLTPAFSNGYEYCSFTTDSFSPFSLVQTYKGGSGSSSSSSSSKKSSVTPAANTVNTATYASDTTKDFSVNGSYQFKITSENGKAPVFVIGTPGVFDVQLVKVVGSDYYYNIMAIGASGTKAGIYVNGEKLLVATVSTTFVKSDTVGSFKVKTGKTYTFKLTSGTIPTFTAGTNSAFKVAYVGGSGSDSYFKITAVGKAGTGCGFYINSQKTPVAVAMIVK